MQNSHPSKGHYAYQPCNFCCCCWLQRVALAIVIIACSRTAAVYEYCVEDWTGRQRWLFDAVANIVHHESAATRWPWGGWFVAVACVVSGCAQNYCENDCNYYHTHNDTTNRQPQRSLPETTGPLTVAVTRAVGDHCKTNEITISGEEHLYS
jgi:hypothetical protein